MITSKDYFPTIKHNDNILTWERKGCLAEEDEHLTTNIILKKQCYSLHQFTFHSWPTNLQTTCHSVKQQRMRQNEDSINKNKDDKELNSKIPRLSFCHNLFCGLILATVNTVCHKWKVFILTCLPTLSKVCVNGVCHKRVILYVLRFRLSPAFITSKLIINKNSASSSI